MREARSFIAYLRVSTDQQGRHGLGMDAQAAAIRAFLRPGDRLLEPPHVEVESGRRTDRPQLRAALARCKQTGATLLVAKVDRLARNLTFLRSLTEGGVDVAFCDMPEVPPGAVGRFLLSQMALVAELEAGLISERTKAALAVAKARGTKLGGDRGYRPTTPPDGALGSRNAAEARARKATHEAFRLAPVIDAIRAEGITSLHGIAAALGARGERTPKGGVWTATAVRRLVLRATNAN